MRQQLQGQHQCNDCIGSKGRRSHSSVVQNSIKLAADISRILPSTQIYAQVMSNGIDDDQNFLFWVCTWYKTDDEYIKPSYDDESLEPYHPTYLKSEADIYMMLGTPYRWAYKAKHRVHGDSVIWKQSTLDRDCTCEGARSREGIYLSLSLPLLLLFARAMRNWLLFRVDSQSEENDVGLEFWMTFLKSCKHIHTHTR